MTPTEAGESIRGRTAWFGPPSFVAAVGLMFVNIVPLALVPLLLIYAVVLYVVEIVVAAALCAFGGRSRQIAAGIAVSVVTTAILFGLALVVTVLRENL